MAPVRDWRTERAGRARSRPNHQAQFERVRQQLMLRKSAHAIFDPAEELGREVEGEQMLPGVGELTLEPHPSAIGRFARELRLRPAEKHFDGNVLWAETVQLRRDFHAHAFARMDAAD